MPCTPPASGAAASAPGRRTRCSRFRSVPRTSPTTSLALKSEWFDHRLRLNADVFYMQDNGQQNYKTDVDSSGATWFHELNAGNSINEGFEIEMQARPIEGLQIDSSLGYLHYELKDDAQSAATGHLHPLHRRLALSADARAEVDLLGRRPVLDRLGEPRLAHAAPRHPVYLAGLLHSAGRRLHGADGHVACPFDRAKLALDRRLGRGRGPGLSAGLHPAERPAHLGRRLTASGPCRARSPT